MLVRFVVAALVAAVVPAMGACSRAQSASTGLGVFPASASSWREVFARAPRVTVTPLITGYATGDRAIVLDPDDPKLDRLPERHEPSAVIAYAVRHADRGDFLIDAGLSRRFATGEGNYSPALRAMLSQMGSQARQRPGDDAAARLRALGMSPRAVLLTHLHADHTSGLADLGCDVAAVFGLGEDSPAQLSLLGDHLDCRPLHRLDFRRAGPMAPFERVLDVLGDGSIWAISTPGHSPGHVSYVIHARGGPVLITGDAAAYHAQLRHRIRPTPAVHDAAAATQSLHRLAAFVERYPQLRVAVGHEPPAF